MGTKKRLRILIMPKFQLTLLFMNFVVFFLTVFCLGLQLKMKISEINDLGMNLNLGTSHPLFVFLNKLEQEIIFSMGIGVFISFVIMTFITLFLTHKIAGPILRLQSYLTRYLATKKFEPLSFRKNDFFNEIPPLINEVISESLKNTKTEKTKIAG